MDARRGITVLALTLAAAGCEGDGVERTQEFEDRSAYEQLGATADTSEAYQTDAAAPVTPVQGPGGALGRGALTATGNLQAQAPGGPAGSVTVTESGPGTLVLVKIDRFQPGSQLAARIATGSCAQGGQAREAVGEAFQVTPEGFATLEARISTPASAVLDGRHAIQIVTPNPGPSTVLACADLPALD